jgi:allophanate hydrolase subunit 2
MFISNSCAASIFSRTGDPCYPWTSFGMVHASESWNAFCQGTYAVSTQSDRMGYRLKGPTLSTSSVALTWSHRGWCKGQIQVPGGGQPIVMMPDHPTTGGYACIATVIKADLPRLAQVEAGRGSVRFKPISPG